ncbi:MAG: hypothetical protein H6Q00_2069 [Holophagaceae bacterium]|nr:hypothetical protein [Holophagaceae bacterium]
MIPKRYLIATLFIAAMLLIMAVVRGPEAARTGGKTPEVVNTPLGLDSFEKITEMKLQEGWVPRFQGAVDPDQWEAWPFGGAFGTPWEPASAYLGDQGVALNGPKGQSEVALWKGLEWRRYRFDAPIASARLDPDKGTRLLVTLVLGADRYRTQLLEVPEGRVIWSVESGPWSRFSWDGEAVLLGRLHPDGGLLLSSLPLDEEPTEPTLAPWDEKGLPPAPKGIATREDQLWDAGRDLGGFRLMTPWGKDAHLWFPRKDRLWICAGERWSSWRLEDHVWRRMDSGEGRLGALPPLAITRISKPKTGPALRFTTPPAGGEWTEVLGDTQAWPPYDPAWTWMTLGGGLTAWDTRWGKGMEGLPPERQRAALERAFRSDWRTASNLRASVRGWLKEGPEVALREPQGVAWVWTGDRLLLVRLPPLERSRWMRKNLKWK